MHMVGKSSRCAPFNARMRHISGVVNVHADADADAAEIALEDRVAEVAGQHIILFAGGQVHLAIFAYQIALAVQEDAGIVDAIAVPLALAIGDIEVVVAGALGELGQGGFITCTVKRSIMHFGSWHSIAFGAKHLKQECEIHLSQEWGISCDHNLVLPTNGRRLQVGGRNIQRSVG